MKWILFNGLLIAAGLVWLVERQTELAHLRNQKQALDLELKSHRDLAARETRLAPLSIDTNDLRQLRSEQRELMRMRSEIGRLHASSVEALQQQVAAAQTRADQAQKQGDLVLANEEAEKRARAIKDGAETLLDDIRSYAEHKGGQYPSSFNEFIDWAATDSPLAHRVREKHLKFDLSPSSLARGLNPDEFDFIPAKVPPGSKERLVVLREKKPRQLPDGTWARVYGFSSGLGVEEEHSPNRDFGSQR